MASAKLDFEMTPHLEEILQRDAGRLLHPSMKSDTKIHDLLAVYGPEMQLPEPGDKRGILAWLGINESVSEKVLKDYENRIAANNPDDRLHVRGTPESNLVHNLVEVFLIGIDPAWDGDDAEGFEGYVNSAFRMGLRPEFALLCGIHPDNPWVSKDEKERWYIQTAAQHVEDLVRMYAAMLEDLWSDRAKYRLTRGKEGIEKEIANVNA